MGRKNYIDAVAGLMILWMIFGHLQQIVNLEFHYPNILFFFMPWFYYKSGALSKEWDCKTYLKHGGSKLLKPFIIFGLIGQSVLTLCLLIEQTRELRPYFYSPIRNLLLGGTFSGNPPLWFLTSLFVTQFLISLLRQHRLNYWICGIISFACSCLISQVNCPFIPVYIGSGIFGLFFYCIGKLLHPYEGNYKIFIFFLFIVSLLLCLKDIPDIELRYIAQCNKTIQDFIFWSSIALSGCFIINSLFKYLETIFKFHLLSYIGRNAMSFYVLHWIILLISIRLILEDLFCFHNSLIQFIVGGLSCALIIPLYIQLRHFNICKSSS